MGGNGSYSKAHGGMSIAKRTHVDTNYRIDGHKVLVLSDNPSHSKVPMNSNSKSPIYMIAKSNKQGELSITAVAIYENHKAAKVIDLKFDKDGKSKEYANGKGTHMHSWKEDNDGDIGRKSHDKENTYPVETQYKALIKKIENFNEQKHKI